MSRESAFWRAQCAVSRPRLDEATPTYRDTCFATPLPLQRPALAASTIARIVGTPEAELATPFRALRSMGSTLD